MAKVIRIQQNGGPSVLQVESAEVGALRPGEVLLRQEFVGVNFVDTMVRSGAYPQPVPTVPGFEAAGVVTAVSPQVTDFAVGDRVAYFFAEGAYATERTIAASRLVHLPDDITTERAATFLAKGLTAWVGMNALSNLRAGDTALVIGASGSVGAILSRWARGLGATVIGVSGSTGGLPIVRAGATHALAADDAGAGEAIREIAPGGVDVVYDLVGAATFGIAAAAVRDGGTIVSLGAASGQPAIPADLARRRVEIRGGGMPQYVQGATIPIATGALFEAIRSGWFDDLEVDHYAFDDIVRAHENLGTRRRQGLPVLTV